MFTRVVTTRAHPGKVDEVIALFRDAVVPAMQKQHGNLGATLGVNRDTNRVISATAWETEADLQATNEASAYLKSVIAQVTPLLAAPLVIENYEVTLRLGGRQGSHARLTTAHFQPAKFSEALELCGQAAQEVMQLPGIRSVSLLSDGRSATAILGSLWDSEAARETFQASGLAEKFRSRFTGVLAEPMRPAEYVEVVFRV